MKFKLFSILSLTLIGLWPLQTVGEEIGQGAPSAIAMEIFAQGFRHCQGAHRLRAKDIDRAQEKYQRYLKYLDDALAEDQRIASTSAFNINRNIAYCQQVALDLDRKIAEPHLEQGYASCKTAREALNQMDTETASKYLAASEKLKEKAMQISPSILEVNWAQEGERLCDRVKLNIQRLENRLARIEIDKKKVVQHLQNSVRHCSQARQLIKEQGGLVKIEQLQEKVRKQNNAVDRYDSVIDYANDMEKLNKAGNLTKKIATARWCDRKLASELKLYREDLQHRQALQAAAKQALLERRDAERQSKQSYALQASNTVMVLAPDSLFHRDEDKFDPAAIWRLLAELRAVLAVGEENNKPSIIDLSLTALDFDLSQSIELGSVSSHESSLPFGVNDISIYTESSELASVLPNKFNLEN